MIPLLPCLYLLMLKVVDPVLVAAVPFALNWNKKTWHNRFLRALGQADAGCGMEQGDGLTSTDGTVNRRLGKDDDDYPTLSEQFHGKLKNCEGDCHSDDDVRI